MLKQIQNINKKTDSKFFTLDKHLRHDLDYERNNPENIGRRKISLQNISSSKDQDEGATNMSDPRLSNQFGVGLISTFQNKGKLIKISKSPTKIMIGSETNDNDYKPN